ncbi:hypothetical protein [Demequina sediminicola]|uniref:hypothetical protein n=1 Tax=Demequina sediminicola TaxID=1095026 RepID=UPI00078182E8|nr:hypothetical protein [Demequina sediminicola]
MDKIPSFVSASARPVALTLVVIESLALLLFAGVNVAEGVTGGGDLALAVAATLGIFAIALAMAARAIQRQQRWGRSYAIMWQILQVASAALMITQAPIIASSAIVVGLLALAAVVIDAMGDLPDE